MVARLARSWGADRTGTGRKVVWAELEEGGEHVAEIAPELDADALLAAYVDDAGPLEQRFTVELGAVPTELLLDAEAHMDNLVREFTLGGGPLSPTGSQPAAGRAGGARRHRGARVVDGPQRGQAAGPGRVRAGGTPTCTCA